MKKDLLKRLSGLQLVALAFGVLGNGVAFAASPNAVVINEVGWAGSVDSANDEWIELYNPGSQAISLAGWKLRDDGVDAYTFASGVSIPAGGYFLIEDNEDVISNIQADLIYNMSLANSGDSLQLIDENGSIIDTVNSGGGAWYAGSSTNYASMERKTVLGADAALNFASSTGSGAVASGGGAVIGTPKALNSVSELPVNSPRISLVFSGNTMVGDIVKMTAKVENIDELFAYGLGINFDSNVLEYQSAVNKGFLSENGLVQSSFQVAPVSGAAGQLLLAEARTMENKAGRSGGGELFEVTFKVLSVPAANTTVVKFSNDSFAAKVSGDLNVAFLEGSLSMESTQIAPVTNFAVVESSERYQIKLNWTASVSQPDHYRVERLDAKGSWQVLAGVNGLEFIDQDSVSNGGKIVPKLDYQYRVTAVKGALSSEGVVKSGRDNRGIKGDNNRSDQVDGRDLERLARHFGELNNAPGFDQLIDTTYDGRVDGSDLIDIGAGFGQKY